MERSIDHAEEFQGSIRDGYPLFNLFAGSLLSSPDKLTLLHDCTHRSDKITIEAESPEFHHP